MGNQAGRNSVSKEINDTWIELKTFGTKGQTNITRPFMMNHNEFGVIPKDEFHKLYIYNINKNQWRKCNMKYDKGFFRIETAAFNRDTNILYLVDHLSKIYRINLTTFDYKIIDDTETNGVGSNCKSIVINNELHIIGGSVNSKHYIFDEEKLSLVQMHEFKQFENGLIHHELIYIKSRQYLLLFAGQDSKECVVSKDIYKYSINNKKWDKLSLEMPSEITRSQTLEFSVTTNKNESVILLVSGDTFIWIYDLKDNKFIKSQLKYPGYFNSIGKCKNIIINDFHKTSLLLTGYIKKYKMMINQDVLNLILEMIGITEYVHMIENQCSSHWKVCLSLILL